MRWASAVLALPLCACEISSGEIARQCGVSQNQLDAGFAAVDQLSVDQSRKLGRCTLKKVAGSKRVIVLIGKDRGLFSPGRS